MSYGHFSAATWIFLKICLSAVKPFGEKKLIGAHGPNFGPIDLILFLLVTYTLKVLGVIIFGALWAPMAENSPKISWLRHCLI